MPVRFINNYPENDLGSYITKSTGDTLYGELWVYEQFLAFNYYNLVSDETWYLKHNYDLSRHPASKNKREGQVDFLLLSKYGLLVIEVKGGGLRVDENDQYYSLGTSGEYKAQNPFTQVKEYVHSFKKLLDTPTFVYRAIVLPHEAGFKMEGPQLIGYKDFFFSKAQMDGVSNRERTKRFYDFIHVLGRKSRQWFVKEQYPEIKGDELNRRMFEFNPLLSGNEMKRLRSELFPVQETYGYDPQRIDEELIIKENYSVMNGLRRNRQLLIQGSPGTGKTSLAIRFLAESLLKHQKGIYYCANKLIRARLEHIILKDHQLDPSKVEFRIYTDQTTSADTNDDIDFLIFDEAQEYFHKGLYDMKTKLSERLVRPKILILYDPDQAIVSENKELSWYTDFFIESGFSHFLFDENHRCAQNSEIGLFAEKILDAKMDVDYILMSSFIKATQDTHQKLELLNGIVNEKKYTASNKIVLIHSELFENVRTMLYDYFQDDFEELTDRNVNIPSAKIRFTTPIKYRGMEKDAVYLITPGLDNKQKVQNYIGVTRAMTHLSIIKWLE
jgi:GTPase SAR1 family protein